MLFKWAVFVAICISRLCFASEAVLEYVREHFSQRGVLKHNGDFLYVALEEEYIRDLVGMIPEKGFVAPPYFGELYDTGAHISVIYSREVGEPLAISELGQCFDFEVKGCHIYYPRHWEGVKAVWVILVDAPELEMLREKYGLSPGFPFHITVGVK